MTTHPTPSPGPRPDWGTVNRWIDAGKPSLNPDGTWDPPRSPHPHEGGTLDD